MKSSTKSLMLTLIAMIMLSGAVIAFAQSENDNEHDDNHVEEYTDDQIAMGTSCMLTTDVSPVMD